MVILESNDIVGTTHNHSNVPHDVGSASDDTRQALKGSNFGLPIALELTALMQGSIGIVEVRGSSIALELNACTTWLFMTLSGSPAMLSLHYPAASGSHDLLGGTSRRSCCTGHNLRLSIFTSRGHDCAKRFHFQ